MSSRVPILDREALEQAHTGTLLARLQQLRECEEDLPLSNRAGVEEAPDAEVTGYVEFKNTAAWARAYREVKEVLAGREHVPRAEERKALRKRQPGRGQG